MRARSLRFRVTAWFTSVLASSLVLLGGSVYFGLERYLHTALENSLRADAVSIGKGTLESAKERGDSFVVGEINEGFAPEINGRFIRVSRADGSVLYDSKRPLNHSFDPQKIPPDPNPEIASARDETHAGVEPLLVYALPYTTHDGSHFLIEIGSGYYRLRDTLRGLAMAFGFGLPLVLLVASLGGWLVMGRALNPIRKITKQAEQISFQRRHERLPVLETDDELGQLSRTLNRMLDRLEEAVQHIRRFSADASHELRTPLTIIRGELETLIRQSPASPQLVDTLGSALEEVERLTRIVEQLLVLSHLDSQQVASTGDLIDLGHLAKTTADQMRLLCDEKKITIEYQLSPNIVVEGNISRLKQIIVNLLDNAIKFSRQNGTIGIRVSSEDSRALLEVSDTGIGIREEALPHVFERFFRTDKARSRDQGGSGLGLSIVKAIAVAHGGDVEITSQEGAGTRVRLILPLTLRHG